MTQRERDRLVALKKAKKKLITQKQAGEEIGVSERQVRRMLKGLRERGDRSVVHGLRGRRSNRKVSTEVRKQIVEILSAEVYRGFGPTLASEYLTKKHGIQMGREALRQLMSEAKLWRPKRRKRVEIHQWRERKARFGEMIQWDTSDHDWLEGRGEKLYLIHMIDDATSRLVARFVRHDSTEENLKLLCTWLERYGRPLAFYTDKASLFRTTEKRRRDRPGEDMDAVEMPPTQIGRALRELQIAGKLAHSPQAKGRVERSFQTAQDRLVKGMRVEGVRTIEQANAYLKREFLPWWEQNCTVQPASTDDAHRALGREHSLVSALSLVQHRKVMNDHTFRFRRKLYRIDQQDVVAGLRGALVRIEKHLDGTMAVRFQGKPLRFVECTLAETVRTSAQPKQVGAATEKPGRKWMQSFTVKDVPSWREIYRSGALNRI